MQLISQKGRSRTSGAPERGTPPTAEGPRGGPLWRARSGRLAGDGILNARVRRRRVALWGRIRGQAPPHINGSRRAIDAAETARLSSGALQSSLTPDTMQLIALAAACQFQAPLKATARSGPRA